MMYGRNFDCAFEEGTPIQFLCSCLALQRRYRFLGKHFMYVHQQFAGCNAEVVLSFLNSTKRI